jgi:aarF domain-containing kinase
VELCTERLLVMELTPGCKLLDGLRRYGAKLAAEQGQTIEEFELAMRRKIEREGVPARYEGPSAAQIERYLRLARWRDALVNSLIVSFNLVLGWAFGRLERRQTLLPPNAPRMMDILMRVHGTQLLVDGVFNADTHAGNFLLMPDDRIALIDYGSTKRLKRAERLSACCMYAALARRDADTLYNLAVAGGYKSKHMDKEVIVKLLRFGNDTFWRDLLGDKNVAQFMDDLKAQDPYEQAADNLVMASFMSFRLRIVGLALNHPVVCSDWWGRIAEKELEREGVPYRMWTLDFMRELNSATINLATVN